MQYACACACVKKTPLIGVQQQNPFCVPLMRKGLPTVPNLSGGHLRSQRCVQQISELLCLARQMLVVLSEILLFILAMFVPLDLLRKKRGIAETYACSCEPQQ